MSHIHERRVPPWKRTIWQAWLGSRPLPGYIAAAHQSVLNRAGEGVHVRLVRDDDVTRLLPDVAAHPAYRHLPPLHRSEFVRAALLHIYGGVWLDTDAFVIHGDLGDTMARCDDDGTTMPHQAMIGPLKPNTTFTRLWYTGVLDSLARHLDVILRANTTKLNAASWSVAGDCGLSAHLCDMWGRKRIPWEFLLGDVWLDVARRLGVKDYNSMSCSTFDQTWCLKCCTSHWADSIACAKPQHESATDPKASWPLTRRPWMCSPRERRLKAGNGTEMVSRLPAAHVYLSLSSQIPRPVKMLNEEEFLKGSSKLALRAREMLGVNASEPTVAKIGRRDGCISNVTEWLHLGAMAKRDEVLTQVLK